MSALTPQNIVETLEKHPGPLSTVLSLEDFAEPGKLADGLARKWTDRRSEEPLKATQLRKFFHTIKNIERSLKKSHRGDEDPMRVVRQELLQVMPELAYARGRRLIPYDFYRIMKACLKPQMLQTPKDFERFVEFLTAILAYHKLREKDRD